MKHAGKRTAVLILVAGTFVGCEPPPVPTFKPVAVSAAPAPKTRTELTQALVQEDDQFASDVARLPGYSADEHRQALVMLLDSLPKILRYINGEDESPEFKNRIAVITAAKQAVNIEDVDRRRMEAAENQALQSASPAFRKLAASYLYDDKDLVPLLDALDSAISTAAGSVGPMHDLDATNAFVALQSVIDRFTSDLVERFLPEAAPAPTPDQTVTPPATPATPAAVEPAATPAAPAPTPTTDTTATPAATTDPAATPAAPATPAATTDPAATPAAPATPAATTDAAATPAAPATPPATTDPTAAPAPAPTSAPM